MKRLLLDTHVFIWWISKDPQLGINSRRAITDGNNMVYISAASVWEISIKRALGKLVFNADLDEIMEVNHFCPLEITLFHAEQAGQLPKYHQDPFDRMLIAQAQAEGLVIVSADRLIRQYGIRLMDARA